MQGGTCLEGDERTNLSPLESPERAADEERPLYVFSHNLTAEDLSKFYRTHLSLHHRRGMNIVAAVGFLLIGLAAGEYFFLHGTQGYVFELGCGLGFVALSFFLGPIMTRSAVRHWEGPAETRYTFYKDEYEVSRDGVLERRVYGSIPEIILSRGVVYLYAEKDRAFVIPGEALGGRLEAFIAFLELKSGRSAVRVERRKAA